MIDSEIKQDQVHGLFRNDVKSSKRFIQFWDQVTVFNLGNFIILSLVSVAWWIEHVCKLDLLGHDFETMLYANTVFLMSLRHAVPNTARKVFLNVESARNLKLLVDFELVFLWSKSICKNSCNLMDPKSYHFVYFRVWECSHHVNSLYNSTYVTKVEQVMGFGRCRLKVDLDKVEDVNCCFNYASQNSSRVSASYLLFVNVPVNNLTVDSNKHRVIELCACNNIEMACKPRRNEIFAAIMRTHRCN